MLLYANEQYELAETCFARAHALAPTRGPLGLPARTDPGLPGPLRSRHRLARRGAATRGRLPSRPADAGQVPSGGGPRGREPGPLPADRGGAPRHGRGALRPRAHRRGPGRDERRGRGASAGLRALPGLRGGPLRAGAGLPRDGGRDEGPRGARPLREGQAGLADGPGSLARRHRRAQDRGERPPREGHPARGGRAAEGGGRGARGGALDRSDARAGARQPDPDLRPARPARQGGGALPGRPRRRPESGRAPLQLRGLPHRAGPERRGGRGVPQGRRAEPGPRRRPEQPRLPAHDVGQAGRGGAALPGRAR